MIKPHRAILILFAFTALFFSCGRSNLSNQAFGNIPDGLQDSLKKIGDQVQSSEIDPAKDNVINGLHGTTIIISANSLVDGDGKPLTGKVNIQLKENYSLADMVLSNLQTVADKGTLQTEGMLYLTAATPEGQPVKIAKSKPIRIEMPVYSQAGDIKFFKGMRDKNGNINWMNAEEPCKKLIPFPIKMIAPGFYNECPRDLGFTEDPRKWKDSTLKHYFTHDDITKYENTLLATREFKARFYTYCSPELTKIYVDNLNKNMWEIDELMVKYFTEDSIKRVDYELKNPPPLVNGNKAPTLTQDSAYKWLINNAKEWGHKMISTFKAFAAQKLTKIDETKKLDTTKVKQLDQVFAAYETTDFGWINCDRFYNDPRAKNVKLFVETSEAPSIISIIFKNKRVILDGTEVGPNKYKFTQDDELHSKLPKGDTAVILSIGYTDNKITFASKQIIIGQNETEKLDLQPLSAVEAKARLNIIDGD